MLVCNGALNHLCLSEPQALSLPEAAFHTEVSGGDDALVLTVDYSRSAAAQRLNGADDFGQNAADGLVLAQ